MSLRRVLVMANHVDGLGGAERVTKLLAGGLADRGYEVALRGIRPAAEFGTPIVDHRFSVGFMSNRPEAPPGQPSHPPAVRNDMKTEALRNLATELDNYRDGLLICAQIFVMEHVALLGLDRQLAAGTRMIGQYHSSYDMAQATRDYRRLRRTYRKLDKFLLLTEADAEAFCRKGFNNTQAMPNPLAIEPPSVDGERENLVVVIARCDANKQLDHALRAWSMIANQFPDWRLELYGDGPTRADLELAIDDLDIRESARMMGITDDVKGVLLRAKVGLLCSRREGLPMVLVESMACGVPTVTYNSSPGTREIVEDGVTGSVVPVDDIAGLANSLAVLMADEPYRATLAAAARQSSTRYSLETILDRWEDLIARVQR